MKIALLFVRTYLRDLWRNYFLYMSAACIPTGIWQLWKHYFSIKSDDSWTCLFYLMMPLVFGLFNAYRRYWRRSGSLSHRSS